MVGSLTLKNMVNAVVVFITSGTFAVMTLALITCWTLVMGAILFYPQDFSTVASLAASFRIWCFGYNPITGGYNYTQLIMFVLDPIFLGLLVFVPWKKDVIDLIKNKTKLVGIFFLLSIALVSGLLIFIAKSDLAFSQSGNGVLDYQLIRTASKAPEFNLTNHLNQPYSLPKNKVSIVSAFYAHCEHTCPMIVSQARNALNKAGIAPTDVDMMLITLDPENDTVDALKRKSDKLGLPTNWHLLTGDPKTVNDVLDLYKVARVRDDKGNIGHSNLFYVIDKKGLLAFTIGLGSAQEVWLKSAIQLLTKE